MFHVEHIFMLKIAIFALIISIVGCKKPEPNPEIRDPIYADIQADIQNVDKDIVTAQTELADHQKTLSEVVPQTGQIKYAQKRVDDAYKKIDRLKQEKTYLQIRAVERLKQVRVQYKRAFDKGEEWPNPAEFEEYKKIKALKAARPNWDHNERLEKAKRELLTPASPEPAK